MIKIERPLPVWPGATRLNVKIGPMRISRNRTVDYAASPGYYYILAYMGIFHWHLVPRNGQVWFSWTLFGYRLILGWGDFHFQIDLHKVK